MSPAEILDYVRQHRIRLSAENGKLILETESGELPDELVEAARRHKFALLRELDRATDTLEAPNDTSEIRARLLADLKAAPRLIHAAEVVDPNADPVRLVIAIRGVGICELQIDRERWDPLAFLELVEAGGRAS